jgi:hypothetical protein
MFSDNLIDAAANWIGGQQRDPAEDHLLVPLRDRIGLYQSRARAELGRAAAEADGDDKKIGMSVYCGRNGSDLRFATVVVYPRHVLGFLPGESRPAFVYPADLTDAIMARWKAREAMLN